MRCCQSRSTGALTFASFCGGVFFRINFLLAFILLLTNVSRRAGRMTESCQLDQALMQDHTSSAESSSSILSDSQLTQLSSCDEKEHVKVYLRIRPFTASEAQSGESQDCVSVEPPDTVLLRPPGASLSDRLGSDTSDKAFVHTAQRFTFSQVYGPDATQRELFRGMVKDLLKDVLHGGNSLLFTYGVTNAGKTFTFLGPDGDAGILPRSLAAIFGSMEGKLLTGMSVKPQRCRDFVRLSEEQRADEAAFKSNLLRLVKESDKADGGGMWRSSGTMLLGGSSLLQDTSDERLSLRAPAADAHFSVWVSFCEIYNENIHDLLETPPSGAARRVALRLSQDAKGNAFVKDLRWVQVDSADEAYQVVKLGKKNQSFSSTRINQLSSRSHSIFSIRVLKIQNHQVVNVSELCLCDLAGSERCAKTRNCGERLKEAANINNSLLVLGKCINALRHNQRTKLSQHVPFRESKLTRYLQSFFCGGGKVRMMVNINQCASAYDETLQVLKFSALAQKVVLVPRRAPPHEPHPNKGVGKTLQGSLIGWESGLENIQEDDDDDDDDDDDEEMSMEDNISESEDDEETDDEVIISQMTRQQVALLRRLEMALKQERANITLLETRVREEVCKEFGQIFDNMRNDFTERLAREKHILEERADKRLEIFKTMTVDMATACRDTQESQSKVSSVHQLEEDNLGSEGSKHWESVGELHNSLLNTGESSATEDEKRLEDELEKEGRARHERVAERTLETKRVQTAQPGLGEKRASHEDAVSALAKKLQETEEALQEVSKSKEEADAALRDLRCRPLQTLVALEEAQNAREEDTRMTRDADKRRGEEMLERERKSKEEVGRLQEHLEKLTAELQASQQQVADETLRAEQASIQFQAAQEQLRETSAHIASLSRDLRTADAPAALGEGTARESAASESQTLPLSLEQLREMVGHRAKEFREQRQLVQQLQEKLQQQQETSGKRLEDVGRELHEQEASCWRLQQKISEQECTTERLKMELQEANAARSAAEGDLAKVNSDLRAQAASLKTEEETCQLRKDEEVQTDELHTPQTEGPNAAELECKLREQMAQTAALQKKLRERREEDDDDNVQVLQECRHREAERRRELLAVAHEAIEQKDAELDKRALQITKLKELAKQDSDKVASLISDLERKEEDSADLREKLADYKKQMQQVHKDIATMKEEERLLRQKLSDADKVKKQLQSDLGNRDRTIQQLKAEQPAGKKHGETLQLYHQARQELQAKERLVDDMRSALVEQEETQEQMDRMLDQKVQLVQELSNELEQVKKMLRQQNGGGGHASPSTDDWSHDLQQAKQEAASAHQSLKLFEEKQLLDRHKWQEDKMALIGQIKEAEDKRKQEMKKFAEDRERYLARQAQLEAELHAQEQKMASWRQERDALVAALEVQLGKLLASQADKDKIIQQLRDKSTQSPVEAGGDVAETQSRVASLKDDSEDAGGGRLDHNDDAQASSGCPSVLESSEISTEDGRTSRFPRPEMEISFSPLRPDRMALRRRGDSGAVTIKLTRSARKRKSADMDKDDLEAENRRNAQVTATVSEHQEESSGPLPSPGSLRSLRSRKGQTLQKIGDFLQRSPTLIGSKAKKVMGLVSAPSSSSSSSSIGLRSKKSKRKLFSTDISSPMDVPPHPMVSNDVVADKESDHLIIKRRLRSRIGK
ncbi:kinesin-like protein KIF20B isoform X3 [Festucalex cinctus]